MMLKVSRSFTSLWKVREQFVCAAASALSNESENKYVNHEIIRLFIKNAWNYVKKMIYLVQMSKIDKYITPKHLRKGLQLAKEVVNL